VGPLLRSFAEVCEPMELLFGVVSGVTPGIHVLDGSSRASMGRGDFGSFAPIFPMVSMEYFVTNVFDSCVKSLSYFCMVSMLLESTFH